MKRNDVVFLLVSTVILTIAWIVFSVMHASTTSTISSDLGQQIEPIAPAFDIHTINALNNRQKITPLYSAPNPSPSVTPSPIPTNSPIPLSLSPTLSASGGGVTQ